MKLLNELIEKLADEHSSLTDALLKTKLLLHQIGQQDLTPWVKRELEGYARDEELPDYRRPRGKIVGDVVSMTARHTDFPLPLMHLDPDMRVNLETIPFRQAIGVMQGMSQGDGVLQKTIPLELNGLLGKQFQAGSLLESARTITSRSTAQQIVIQVRSRLLDFALRLRDQIGETKEADVKTEAASANAGEIFRSAIFGDHATIIVGNNNTQAVGSHNKQGDIEGLIEVLRQAKVADADLLALRGAIATDGAGVPADVKGGRFGPSVTEWIRTQFSKAVDTAWNVELGVAGGLLVEALKHYYAP